MYDHIIIQLLSCASSSIQRKTVYIIRPHHIFLFRCPSVFTFTWQIISSCKDLQNLELVPVRIKIKFDCYNTTSPSVQMGLVVIKKILFRQEKRNCKKI